MNWKVFLKKHWYLIVSIIVLIIFFYPKYCGNWATTAPNMGYTYHDCMCVGIKMSAHPGIVGGDTVNCWGIVISRSCYENRRTEEQGYFRYYKPCEEMNYPEITEEWCDAINPCPEGLECIGFPDIGLRCAQPNPCSYFKCPVGTQCIVAESYPSQVICTPKNCPPVDHIDCMPIVKPEFEEYCRPENKEWIQENCPHILITE